MIAVIPYEIETLRERYPWSNWLIIAICIGVEVAFLTGGLDDSDAEFLALDGFAFPGLFTLGAHIGGLAFGLAIGLIGLQLGWLQITEYDNRTLLEILKREHPGR